MAFPGSIDPDNWQAMTDQVEAHLETVATLAGKYRKFLIQNEISVLTAERIVRDWVVQITNIHANNEP